MLFKKFLISAVPVLVLLSSCANLPVSSDFQYGLLSEAGKTLFSTPKYSHPDKFSYAPLKNKNVNSYVSSIGRRVLSHSGINDEIEFHTLSTPYIQAFNTGAWDEVYITQGMLNTISNEAELASLLGHELGHTELRNKGSEFKDKGRLWDLIADEAENHAGVNIGLSDHRYDIAYANFNQNQEEKADEFGAELAAKSGYNPYALCDLFERLSQNVKDGILVQIGNLKGSHKALKARGEHLRKYLRNKGYLESKSGYFSFQYLTSLKSLLSSQQKSTLNVEERKILAELAQLQQEIDKYQRIKGQISPKRFIHIMGRVSEIARKYQLAIEDLMLAESPYGSAAFMQEMLVQRHAIWGDFKEELKSELSHLLTSLTRIGIGFIPVVGSAVDLYELLSGKDFLTGGELSPSQRALTAVGLLIGQGKLVRGIAPKILRTAKEMGVQREVKEAVGYANNLVNSGAVQRFGPLNKGPLHLVKAGKGTVADTFRSGSYLEVTVSEPTKLYRVYGGKAGQLSPYWSKVKPSGPLQATLDTALDPSWGNHASKWTEITIPAQTKIYEGAVSEVALHSGKSQAKVGQLLGGGSQVYISREIPKSWITDGGLF